MAYDLSPGTLDLVFVRGDDFSVVLDVEGDRDADTFTAEYSTRADTGGSAFTVAVGSYDSGDDSTPVTLTLTDATTAALSVGTYYWDLQWVTGSTTRTLLAGKVTVLPDIS